MDATLHQGEPVCFERTTNIFKGHFDLRTVYNFRHRIAKHMQESGENLIDQAFEQVTDEQVAAFNLKTNKFSEESGNVQPIRSICRNRKRSI